MESDGGNDEGRFIRGQFDSNGDGVFGDNSKMLNAGAFTINARDTVPENATITSTDANGAATGQFALQSTPGREATLCRLVQASSQWLPSFPTCCPPMAQFHRAISQP